MSRWIAFLRAINVGGHTVKMDHLRQLFESLGFSSVETHGASGNVAFETAMGSANVLERRIEGRLREALGYDVATFIRSAAELADIANYAPFPQSDLDAAAALNIAFLFDRLNDEAIEKLMALRTAIDDFHVHEREVYWLCQRKQSESTFSNAVLEKTVGMRSTLRGVNTVKQMAAKYGSPR